MPLAVTRRPVRASSPALLLAALLSALLTFATVAVTAPTDALAATTLAANCGTNLRTSASTSARIRTSVAKDVKVTAVATVSGGSWRALCSGKSVSGSKWYRISAVNGKSVSSLYGVTYLYAATGLFRTVSTTTDISTASTATTMWANCYVNLRTSATTTATRKVTIKASTRVTVVATVSGGAWTASCAGKRISSSSWIKISGINGRSVRTLYGVSYLYAAKGMFRTSSTTSTTTTTPTTLEAACGVNLRRTASTAGTLEGKASTGSLVTVSATVTGTAWSATCAGKWVSGNKWVRISAVNGKSASSLYGVSVVYGMAGTFRTPPAATTYYAQCDGVNLRTSSSTGSGLEGSIDAATAVGVVGTVSGGSWSATCAGKTVSSTQWRKISTVAGKSVQSLYGVPYVYGASSLFATTKPAPPPPPPPDPEPEPEPPGVTEGIDVSHWNGTIDWTKVKAAGKRFTFIKASENDDFVDDKYATNRAGAKAAGLYVGAYHFADPSTAAGDAAAEADHFIATAKVASGDLLPVLDLEVTRGLSPEQLQVWTKEFLQRLYEKTGHRAVLYTSPAFWKSAMGDTTWFADNGYKVLWIAHWTTASSPSMPAANWGGAGWSFWQYSATGSVPGISGNVDLNRYNGTNLGPVLVP